MTTKTTSFGIGVTGIYFLWLSLLPSASRAGSILWFLGVLWTAWGVGLTVTVPAGMQGKWSSKILGGLFLVTAMCLNDFTPMFYSKWYNLQDYSETFELLQIAFGVVCIAFVLLQPFVLHQKKATQIPAYPPTGKRVPRRHVPKRRSKPLPPNSKLPKGETKIYGLSTAKQTTSSFKLPSGEIRCGNCGFVNDPRNDYCEKCGKRL